MKALDVQLQEQTQNKPVTTSARTAGDEAAGADGFDAVFEGAGVGVGQREEEGVPVLAQIDVVGTGQRARAGFEVAVLKLPSDRKRVL